MIQGPNNLTEALLLGLASLLMAIGVRFGSRMGLHFAVDFANTFRLLAQWMVVLASLRLPRKHRKRYRAEWQGELDALRTEGPVPPTVSLLVYAIPLLFLAGHLARELVPEPALALQRTRSRRAPSRRSPPRSRRSRYLFKQRARRLGRARMRFRRVVVGIWIATVMGAIAGIPFAEAGFRLAARLDHIRPIGGIETSEITQDLMTERAARQMMSP